MLRARKLGVLTPVVYFVELDTNSIYMEKIAGHSIKHCLHTGSLPSESARNVMMEVGHRLALLHDGGLIHGDLTTSNMLIRDADGAVVRRFVLVLPTQQPWQSPRTPLNTSHHTWSSSGTD